MQTGDRTNITGESVSESRAYHNRRAQAQRAARESYRLHWLDESKRAIAELAPKYPEIAKVYLYGSIVQPGRFRADSDIDFAIEADSIEVETPLWRSLEQTLRREIDLRPLLPPITLSVDAYGELVYARKTYFSA